MTQLPALVSGAPISTELRLGVEVAFAFAEQKRAASTRDGYASDFRLFDAWCHANGLAALPAAPAAVATYVAMEAQRGIRPATLRRRLAAIQYVHREAGHEAPADNRHVRDVMSGIRNTMGVSPDRKAPATAELVMEMLKHCPGTLAGKRDRALIALGFAGAFRRSELVGLQVSDLTEAPDGYRVLIRRSKTDQEGEGRTIAIPRGYRLRPVEAVQTWLAAAEINDGPVLRAISKGGRLSGEPLTGRTVADLVKRYAMLAGLDPTEFSGHSLRAGFLTSAAEAGASVFKMMEVSRHRSVDTLSGYVRDADAFKDHAGAAFL